MMGLRSRGFVALGTLLALVAAPSALAASSDDVYGGVAGEIQGDVDAGALGETASGTLPFTGLNLTLIVVGGLLLIATGVLLKRRSGSNPS